MSLCSRELCSKSYVKSTKLSSTSSAQFRRRHHADSLSTSATGMKFPDGLSGLMSSSRSGRLSAKYSMRSSAVYLKSGLVEIYGIISACGRRLGYSSKVGYITPMRSWAWLSANDFISSAAPLPTIMYSWRMPKYFAASKELTCWPEGYSVSNVAKLAFISSIRRLGGKNGLTR